MVDLSLAVAQIESFIVVPAKAGIQGKRRAGGPWVPAFAGTTMWEYCAETDPVPAPPGQDGAGRSVIATTLRVARV
jgi:hypothetical protein